MRCVKPEARKLLTQRYGGGGLYVQRTHNTRAMTEKDAGYRYLPSCVDVGYARASAGANARHGLSVFAT